VVGWGSQADGTSAPGPGVRVPAARLVAAPNVN
jgi:hypothetical protein